MEDVNLSRPTTCETNATIEAYTEAAGLVGIIVPTIFAFVVTIGLLGNLLVIIVVISNQSMRNTTNALITNLAVADLAFIIICVPFTAYRYTTPVWPFGEFWCKFMNYTMFTSAWTSIYTLVLMSFDRFLAVVYAVPSLKLRTPRNAGICIGVLWVVMLSVNGPAVLVHGLESMPYTENGDCKFFHSCEFNGNQVFVTCFFVFGYLLPLCLVCALYGCMLKRLLFAKSPGSRSVKAQPNSQNSRKRATRLVFVIVSIFAICWLPIHIVLMSMAYNTQASTNGIVFHIASNVLAFSNSCVNPILYAFLSDKFRQGFNRILCCGHLSTHMPLRPRTTLVTQNNV